MNKNIIFKQNLELTYTLFNVKLVFFISYNLTLI